MIHSVLIIGQSNMAGRGFLADAPRLDTVGGRLQVLRNGRWQGMFRPVNPDRPFSGTCLAERFAQAYAMDHEGVTVGVIPCADGGTTLDQWKEGSLLFDNAVYQTRLAMRTSHLVAILWHQGEGDCGESKHPLYLEKITKIMTALRRELDAQDVPLLVGGLGDFLKDRAESPALANYPYVNDALRAFAASSSHTAYVDASGLKSNPDNLHFCREALDEFGQRYYDVFRTLEDKDRVFDEKSKMDDAVRTEMELL